MKVLFLINDYLTQPLGVGYLSSVLCMEGHFTEAAALRDKKRIKKLLNDFNPDVLALSLVTGREYLFLETAKLIKEVSPRISVFAGGPHPTFYPDFIKEKPIDAVCIGEGELAFREMLRLMSATGRVCENIPNWNIKRENGEVVCNDVAPLIEELDSLSYPDRGIFDRACPGRNPAAVYVMASRGCPYKCSYCFNHSYNELYKNKGTICRRRSVWNVIGEIKELKKRYPLQIAVFQDDTFNLDKKWLLEFSELFPKETDVAFHCHLRADLLDEESAEMLRHAGCISVKLGLEAGSEHIRNRLFDRSMSIEEFERACSLLRKNRIAFAVENILGAPDSTLEDDLLTYILNRRVKPAYSFATMLQLYPGTRIAGYALKNNNGYTQYPDSFYKSSKTPVENSTERGRLRAVFAIGVALGLPVKIIKNIISLNVKSVFEFIDKLWKGYCLRFRLYPYSIEIRTMVKETLDYLKDRYY